MTSAGDDAIDLAASAGLHLDPWQQYVLREALGERPDGKWSAFEVGLIVARQNGKGAVLEARELAGLFLFGEQLILHSAHEFKTAAEAFRRVHALVENTDDLRKKVARVRTSHGDEGIELKTGARLRFVARSTGSGRGFSGDCVILDEAYNLGANAMAALLPTLSARPNPQLWYTSSAGDSGSEQLAAVKKRGESGTDPGLAYFDWSAAPDADPLDRAAWAAANPGLGIRINEDFVEREQRALPEAEFARERLSIWDGGASGAVIPTRSWQACQDADAKYVRADVIAVDASPDRTCAIATAGSMDDESLTCVRVVEYRDGTGWVVDRLVGLHEQLRVPVVLDPAGPAGAFLADLEARGVQVRTTSARDMAQACGGFVNDVVDARVRHIGQEQLTEAVAAARKRPLADAFAWARKGGADISPLVAATLAVWASRQEQQATPSVWFI